jgi:2-aminoadipate transaminase
LQRAIYRLFSGMDFDAYLAKLQVAYADRARHMLAALQREMRPDVEWTTPQGGFFIWITLPDGTDDLALSREAAQAGVLVVGGSTFYANEPGRPAIRLSFSQATHGQIDEGIAKLAAVIDAHLTSRGVAADSRVRVEN